VVLVVTPDPQSQAEAFALLRVLQLNGFSGELCIVVNKVTYAMDASDIHQALSNEISTHLGFNAGMLEVLLEDDSVPRSERYKQAFSAVFPESEAAAGIVAIADDIDTVPDQSSGHALVAYWERFIEFAGAPIRLTGDALLEAPEVAAEECEVEVDDSTGAAGAVGN
jgi:MinD-like ATPase involved in chromosome partitioning or flagellar assembly